VLREYLLALPKTAIVLCTDGYDVLYTRSANEILSRFTDFGVPVVFSGEKNCYHHFPESKNYFEQAGNRGLYRYLNSGLIIGYAGAIQSMLEEILALETAALKLEFSQAKNIVGFFNDQSIYGRYACQNPEKVAIDTNADLFWTMCEEKFDLERYAEISLNGVRNLESNTQPCLVHVSHRRKFYLVYLNIAWKMGIQLTSGKLDSNLLKHLLQSKADDSKREQITTDPKFINFLNNMHKEKPVQKQSCDRVAIIFIGTGRYIEYFKKYYATSRKLFLPNTPKRYFVFTDDAERAELLKSDDIVPVETKAESWPFSTLFRFRYIDRIHQQLAAYSHIIFIDADMYVSAHISEEAFFSHDKPLFGVQHPGNYMNGLAPYESNPESSAAVTETEEKSIYWQGCFWGGKAEKVLTLSRILAERVEEDLSRNIIARWHDESHLNKYFIENHVNVHTYHPGYAYPEMLAEKLPVEKKIIHVMKNHSQMRSKRIKTGETEKRAVSAWDAAAQRLDDDAVPMRNNGYHLEETPGSMVICDDDHIPIVRINETGAQIWRLCEGNFSIGELINLFSTAYSISPQTVREDLYPVLRNFVDSGLVYKKNTTCVTDGPKDSSGIRFYSFANNLNVKYLSVLKESAKRHNIGLTFLGAGLKRFTTALKIDLLYEQLCALDDNEIVCAVDGYDIFFCADGGEIKEKFLSLNCDCVISTERAYSHQYEKYRKFYEIASTESPYRYINAGSIIGYAGALRKIYSPTLSTKIQSSIFTVQTINKIKKWSEKIAKKLGYKNFNKNDIYAYIYYTDQQQVGKYIARNPEKLKITLDYDTTLFWCCAWEWKDIHNHFRIEKNKIVNNHTNNAPMVIHVPGWRAYGHIFTKLYEIQRSNEANIKFKYQ